MNRVLLSLGTYPSLRRISVLDVIVKCLFCYIDKDKLFMLIADPLERLVIIHTYLII